MFPPVGNCRGCRLRQRELARLRQQLGQLENDNRRLLHRLAKLKKDNDLLRQQLDEARRQPHRQAGHFRRTKLKKRKKNPAEPRDTRPNFGPRPRRSTSIASSTSRAVCAPTAKWS